MYKYTRPNPPMPSDEDVARFWSYVLIGEPNECWPWRTRKKASFWWNDENGNKCHQGSPRVALRISTDGDINSSAVVAHSCDYPPCCNPAHLSAITQQVNIQQCVERGRHPRDVSDNYKATRRKRKV